jgi:hypothetical protein
MAGWGNTTEERYADPAAQFAGQASETIMARMVDRVWI